MIPAITPPTDNLYKFLSLFGLTIFLFALYNLGSVSDQVTRYKMEFEGVKTEFQQKVFQQSHSVEAEIGEYTSGNRFRSLFIRQLGEDVRKVEQLVKHARISTTLKISLIGKLNKLGITLDHSHSKLVWCWIILSVGVVIMFIGFLSWFKKEQKLRDNILKMEHITLSEKKQNIKGNQQPLPEEFLSNGEISKNQFSNQ